jgi:hypothetical protein
MNYEEINVQPRDLKSQWRSFRQFWTEYAATIAPLEPQQWWEQPTVVSPDLEALLLSARATAKLPSNETLTQALEAELLQLLSRVVHPRDLEVLRQYFDWGDFVDLALWLYGWRGSNPRAELYPTVPQPCYGSPLNAKVFTIFNNPGADPRIEARDDSLVWKQFVDDQKRHLKRHQDLERAGVELPLLPWATEQRVEGKEGKPKYRYERYLYFGNGTKDTFMGQIYGIEAIFHLDFLAYQSKDSKAKFVNKISKMNEKGVWLPSQEHSLLLAAAWANQASQSGGLDGAKPARLIVRKGKFLAEAICARLTNEQARSVQGLLWKLQRAGSKYLTENTLVRMFGENDENTVPPQ